MTGGDTEPREHSKPPIPPNMCGHTAAYIQACMSLLHATYLPCACHSPAHTQFLSPSLPAASCLIRDTGPTSWLGISSVSSTPPTAQHSAPHALRVMMGGRCNGLEHKKPSFLQNGWHWEDTVAYTSICACTPRMSHHTRKLRPTVPCRLLLHAAYPLHAPVHHATTLAKNASCSILFGWGTDPTR